MKKKIIKIKPSFDFEAKLWDEYTLVAGVDEAGRGCLAGPVVAAAVVFPKGGIDDFGINDSKKLSPEAREGLYDIITEQAVSYAAAQVDNKEIDKINILRASLKAMHIAVGNLSAKPDFLLIDGNRFFGNGIPFNTIVKGDGKSISIAAASIIAKVTRDRLMAGEIHELYPQYGFASHKGYATKAHFDAIREHGPCPLHRKSFLRKFFEREDTLF